MNSKLSFQKLTFLLIINVLLFASSTFAEEISFNNNWGKQGFTVTNQKSSGVEINFSIHTFSMSKNMINGKLMDEVGLPGVLLPNNEGAPNLPGNGRYLAIPEGANPVLKVVSFQKETYNNVDIAPAPRIPWDTEDGPLEYSKNTSIYQKNAMYPANPFQLSEVTQIRGVDAVIVGITPFQYNPVTKELIVYRDVRLEINFVGGKGQFGEDRLRSRSWDPLLNDLFLNHASLPKIDYNKKIGTKDIGCEYLIISPNNANFLKWADSIKTFRTLQGIATDVVTMDDVGGNSPETIESYINNAYLSWDIVPSAVLLLADYGTSGNTISSHILPHPYSGTYITDNLYADVSGNSMPDIIFARMTAQNEAQLEVMITKFLNYERTPPTSSDFYDHPITALGFQTERWFQICSESVAGFWENSQGKNPVRINKVYDGNPNSDPWSTATNTGTVLNYFGPSGLNYIPATPSEVNCSWNGSAQNVVVGINNGAFMLQHRDHGGTTGWGEPSFQSNNINSLNNTDLSFIWSINCLTGKFNISGECFAEKFHRHTSGSENSGALGLIAATEVSYSFVNDTYVWGAYDNQWPDFMPDYGSNPESRGILPAFGNVAGKYFLQQSSWPYNTDSKEITYNLFHMHGDAFSTVYSEVPQNLTVNHNPVLYSGLTTFDISANVGAFIGLTVNGEIIGIAVGTGSTESISIPVQVPTDQLVITITKQNYYRYTSIVDVVPAAGSYVVNEDCSINDMDAGNNNGMMDYGETNLLNLSVKNVGVEQANNVIVTISSTDNYITITDNLENYGNIAPDESVMMEDAYSIDVANDIPDGHIVNFEVNATDGSDTWLSYMSIEGHAPLLDIGNMIIDDSDENGNGQFDPGETVNVIIETYNNGSSDALETLGSISISNSYVTVNNLTYDFNNLNAGSMNEAVFSISVSSDAPIGTAFEIGYDVTSGEYNIQDSFGATIGLILENWETGNMTQYEWETGGSGNWTIENTGAYEGTYCAKSGFIGDSQSSFIKLVYDVFSDDVISFWLKVSSENNYDFLKFYIDGNEQDSWSGEVNWQEVEYGVTEGTHTFLWVYYKDQGVSDGSDCGWIDFIVLPAPPLTSLFADFISDITSVCEGETVSFQETSSGNPISWNWTFEGGTPETSTEQNPVVTYNLTGNYNVTLEVSDGVETVSSTIEDYISTIESPNSPEMPNGESNACTNIYLAYEYTIVDVANASSYEWILSPAEAGNISGTGTTGTVIWTADWTGVASVQAKAINNCGESDLSQEFDIMCSICTGIAEDINESNLKVFPNPNTGSFTFELNGFNKEVILKVYSSLGNEVYQSDKLEVNGNFSQTIDLNIDEGVYFLRIVGDNIWINKKLIIRK